ncbi:citrate/2-methylcitrate synthase [Desulfolutivibrio sulfoxidireducens]|uniref:citrate/2-methylcitrate synthase n=1 Tax=Desulfolutivibrio sulfoxidireducens TaxID=2773299 RepID=UPI00159E1920|nr:citrate/2-methylcitrate synthase [Desulfolutivibrio sulfoxidireducens]QLA15538.1 citrate (Si)-synthase [Desulfolutivibrio sulfoxidireducens]
MKKESVATIAYDGKTVELPLITGTEGETGIDVTSLRSKAGWITFDPGFANTGACKSGITHIDGERGTLRYRGYPLEQLAERASFIETAMLLMFGDLPARDELAEFRGLLRDQELLHESLLKHLDGFPPLGQPMAILSAMINSLGSYYPELLTIRTDAEYRLAAAKIISKVRTIAAFSYRKAEGLPFMYPNPHMDYCRNFLHMMFSVPFRLYEPPAPIVRALSLFLIAHADHGLDTSGATVRMVGSSQANLFACISAAVCALWGRLHGGAGVGVMEMFEEVHGGRITAQGLIEEAKSGRRRLMGFGQRVYKNYDPRAILVRKAYEGLLTAGMARRDARFDIALDIEARALADDYFLERRLYPNVNYYSGLLLRAINIPVPMFPVMVAIGNMPGWIAHWHEEWKDAEMKIHRPRQVYTGRTQREYVPMDKR